MQTIRRPASRQGVWIFPHQNNADFVMNSAAEYEAEVRDLLAFRL